MRGMAEFPSPHWNARWIALDADPRTDLGVFALRCSIELSSVPSSFVVRLSADQRYKLFVNGQMVAFGPQRGDVRHWFYETLDLAPFLREGVNWIAALVWNFGRWAPMAQHTAQTGFVFESESCSDVLTTPGQWQIAPLPSWDFKMMHSSPGYFYIDVGPGESLDGRTYPVGWEVGEEKVEMSWRTPYSVYRAEARGNNSGGTPWMLIPRSIPLMKYAVRSAQPVVRHGFAGDPEPNGKEGVLSSEIAGSAGTLPAESPSPSVEAIQLKPGTKLLLDYQELLCAYPRIALTGPAGAEVVITYAEGLWRIPEEGKWWGEGGKGNRNDVKGKAMQGNQDRIILGEGTTVYEPLWWRTYRYMMIEVPESDVLRPTSYVNVVSLDAIETGYPLAVESSFSADDAYVKPLWDVSIRTAQRCAGEHYFDCPYYEQLQYAGDTRIQTLIGYYLGKDRQLQRNAVETMGWSLMENGLTQSRYPSRQTQVIPPFSLWWVMMVHDQMLYDDWYGLFGWDKERSSTLESGPTRFHRLAQQRDESDEYKSIQKVINGFSQLCRRARHEQGAFWPFADWVPAWHGGVPASGINATVHRLTASLASMARFCYGFDVESHSITPEKLQEVWQNLSNSYNKLDNLVKEKKDEKWQPSEHSEALYRILQEQCGLDPDPWPTEALAKANAALCTYYFAYYKHQAMFARDDNPFDYMEELKPWKEMIEQGLSTFAENPEPTRSDCHAWSAHPILGFFQIVAGVTSIEPGWKKAQIRPRPGSLKRFDAHIAHPDGDLNVKFEEGKLVIDTPIKAKLVWQGKQQELEPGKHSI